MTDQTKTILLSALVVAIVYAGVEFFAKPKISQMAGVKVR